MFRRELLSTVVHLLTGTLAGIANDEAASPSVEQPAGPFDGPVAINRTSIESSVVDRSRSAVTVRFRSQTPTPALVPVVSRREYPGGRMLDAREGPTLDAATSLFRQLTIPVDERRTDGRWMYVIGVRPRDDPDAVPEYLCESDPLGTDGFGPLGSVDPTPPVPGATDRPSRLPGATTAPDHGYRRTPLEGRFALAFDWRDATGTAWTLTHEVSKSAYVRARRRQRGYARTYLESRRNPYASHLTERLVSDATPKRPVDAGAASTADAFARVVGFVQSFAYVRDEASKGRHDYHRTVEESLVDGVCDCKDGTYLLAGLLAQSPFEYETAVVLLPDHLLLGVHRDDLPARYRDRETLRDSPYVPIETTTRTPVGEFPAGPVVAIVGPSAQVVDVDALDETLRTQIRLFASHYGR